MTQKPRKGDFRELKSKKFQGGACHWTPREACSSGACLRKLINIYLRSAPECYIYKYLFTYPMSSWIDATREQTHEFNETVNSDLPIRTVAHYFEEILFYVQSFQKRQ